MIYNNIDINKINILHEPTETEPFVLIYKPKGIPSAPLANDDLNNALSFTAEKFTAIKNVKGKKEIEYGLVHRIDTETDGLLLIASDQNFYNFIISEQQNNNFIKTYHAKCDFFENIKELKEGFSYCENSELIKKLKINESVSFNQKSYFRPFGTGRKEVRPVDINSGKAALKKAGNRLYETEIKIIRKENYYEAVCKITNGFRHQVRCHLAWCGLCIKGDKKYNPQPENDFHFSATGLQFRNYICPEGDLNSYEIALTST